MTARDKQMADVEITLHAEWQARHDEALAQLKLAGLGVKEMINDEGMIRGIIPRNRLNELRGLPCVAYVRTVLTYDDQPPPDRTSDPLGFRPL